MATELIAHSRRRRPSRELENAGRVTGQAGAWLAIVMAMWLAGCGEPSSPGAGQRATPAQPALSPAPAASVSESTTAAAPGGPAVPSAAELASTGPPAGPPAASGAGAGPVTRPDPEAVLAELRAYQNPPQGPPTSSPPRSAAPAAVAPAAVSGVPLPQSLGKLSASPRSISLDGRSIAAISGNATVLLAISGGQKVREFSGHSSSVRALAFSPDWTRLATCSYDDTARLWDVESGQEIRQLASGGSDFEDIAYSPDGTQIAAVNDDKNLWVWDAAAGEPKKVPTGTSNYQRQVAFSPDGRTIITLGAGTLIYWDAKTLTRRAELATPDTQLAVGRGGNLLATYGGGRAIRLRSLADGEVVHEVADQNRTVQTAAFSPSGKRLVSVASDATEAIVWDASTGQKALRLPHRKKVTWAAFWPDGSRVCTYTDANTLRAWDMRILGDPEKHRAFAAWFDGGEDNFLRFIRMFLVPPELSRQIILYPESWGGKVLTRIVNSQGTAFDAIDVRLGGSSIESSVSVEVGSAEVSVDTKKLRSLEVLAMEDKTARLKLTLLDGSTVMASKEACEVTGRFAFGEITYDLANVSRLLFNAQRADEARAERPKPDDAPVEAWVIDSQGTRLDTSDLRLNRSDRDRSLTFYVDNGKCATDLRYLRKLSVLAVPQGGVIARLEFVGNRQLLGFIPSSEVSRLTGAIGLAKFTVDMEQLGVIEFH